MRLAAKYFALARERESIRRGRLAGALPPWTHDPIFRQWRFCNVHRENDRTTIWFRDHGLLAVCGCAVGDARGRALGLRDGEVHQGVRGRRVEASV
jgi:hypothetical protein